MQSKRPSLCQGCNKNSLSVFYKFRDEEAVQFRLQRSLGMLVIFSRTAVLRALEKTEMKSHYFTCIHPLLYLLWTQRCHRGLMELFSSVQRARAEKTPWTGQQSIAGCTHHFTIDLSTCYQREFVDKTHADPGKICTQEHNALHCALRWHLVF